jgi:hypothetical protein
MLAAAFALAVAAGLLLWLGIRLWRAAAPGAPERWLALSFAGIGLGAVPRLAAARLLTEGGEGVLTLALSAASQLAIESAIVGLSLFTWRVFRPASRGARAFALGVALASGGATLCLLAVAGSRQEVSALALLVNATRAVPVLWAFVECARYALLMRRRLALGLADPLVANRFVLWSVWTGALGVAAVAILSVRSTALWLQLHGIEPRSVMPAAVPLTGALAGVAVATAGVAIWLAFFPPAAYRRWLEARPA